jgi:hypothetical protein
MLALDRGKRGVGSLLCPHNAPCPRQYSGPIQVFVSSPFWRIHRRKALAFWRGVLGCVNPPIGEALAFDAAQRDFRAHGVVHAELDAVVVAEGKFVEVALEVLFAARNMICVLGDADA